MSKMAELDYDIQEMFIDGHDARSIARILDCPVEMVLGTLETFGVSNEDIVDMPEVDEIYSPYSGA
jgi:predicted nucleic acid-binding protein